MTWWNEEENTLLKQLKLKKLSCLEIARAIGRSPSAVRSHWRYLNYREHQSDAKKKRQFRDRESRVFLMRKNGMKWRDIASIFNTTINTIASPYYRRIHHEMDKNTKNRSPEMVSTGILIRTNRHVSPKDP